MNEPQDPLSPLEWRVRVVMAERGLKTVTSLQRLLSKAGIEVSTQHLSTVVNGLPERLNLVLLSGLCTVLDCDVSDLLRRKTPPERQAQSPVAQPMRPRQSRLRGAASKPVDIEEALGKITPLNPERRSK